MSDIDTMIDEIDGLLGAFLETAFAAWEMGGFNEGQSVIFLTYVMPALESWAGGVEENWPWGNSVGDYEWAMYDAYDTEVMDRAFSDTISEPMGAMEDIQATAQQVAVFLEFIGFS